MLDGDAAFLPRLRGEAGELQPEAVGVGLPLGGFSRPRNWIDLHLPDSSRHFCPDLSGLSLANNSVCFSPPALPPPPPLCLSPSSLLQLGSDVKSEAHPPVVAARPFSALVPAFVRTPMSKLWRH